MGLFGRLLTARDLGQLSENGIDEWACRCFAGLLDQLHALGDGGVRRDAVEILQLIAADAQRGAHLGIESFHLAPRAGGDRGVERALPAQTTQNDLRGEPVVAAAKVPHQRHGVKQLRGVSAVVLHAQQNGESGLAGRGNGHARPR